LISSKKAQLERGRHRSQNRRSLTLFPEGTSSAKPSMRLHLHHGRESPNRRRTMGQAASCSRGSRPRLELSGPNLILNLQAVHRREAVEPNR
jgi:hypothetical protein